MSGHFTDDMGIMGDTGGAGISGSVLRPAAVARKSDPV